jgi:hypothetical protein
MAQAAMPLKSSKSHSELLRVLRVVRLQPVGLAFRYIPQFSRGIFYGSSQFSWPHPLTPLTQSGASEAGARRPTAQRGQRITRAVLGSWG